jgi:hypothetical protein
MGKFTYHEPIQFSSVLLGSSREKADFLCGDGVFRPLIIGSTQQSLQANCTESIPAHVKQSFENRDAVWILT